MCRRRNKWLVLFRTGGNGSLWIALIRTLASKAPTDARASAGSQATIDLSTGNGPRERLSNEPFFLLVYLDKVAKYGNISPRRELPFGDFCFAMQPRRRPMKKLVSIAFALVLGAVSLPALSVVAPVEMTAAHACGTGGNASRSPHCNTTYLQSCQRLGYSGPCGFGGQRAGNGGYYGQQPVYRTVPARQARPHYHAGRTSGHYGAGMVPRARRVAAPPPPPSPEQVARMAKHTTKRVAVDCVSTHTRVEGSNRCVSVRWIPGDD